MQNYNRYPIEYDLSLLNAQPPQQFQPQTFRRNEPANVSGQQRSVVVNTTATSTPSEEPKYITTTKKKPFYRTAKGAVLFIILAIVILAAIIGGAVGGSLKHKPPPQKQSFSSIPGLSYTNSYSQTTTITLFTISTDTIPTTTVTAGFPTGTTTVTAGFLPTI